MTLVTEGYMLFVYSEGFTFFSFVVLVFGLFEFFHMLIKVFM